MSIGHKPAVELIAARGDLIFQAKSPIEAATRLLTLGSGKLFFSF